MKRIFSCSQLCLARWFAGLSTPTPCFLRHLDVRRIIWVDKLGPTHELQTSWFPLGVPCLSARAAFSGVLSYLGAFATWPPALRFQPLYVRRHLLCPRFVPIACLCLSWKETISLHDRFVRSSLCLLHAYHTSSFSARANS